MPVLLKMNLKCNYNCKYCYQHPIRPIEEIIDHEKVTEAIHQEMINYGVINEKGEKLDNKEPNKVTVTLHGGEPTLLPIKYIKKYLRISYEYLGKSSMQTNGYHITDEMVQLFKRYNTHVGFSIDGPPELDILRGFGSDEERLEQAKKVYENLDRLQREEISVSIIAVIHKLNGKIENRQTFKDWLDDLHQKKISGRLNICCSGDPDIDLTVPEAIEFYSDIYDYVLEKGYKSWSPYKDIINSLKGNSNVVCVYRSCDPLATSAATSVLNDGSVGGCLRLHIDGKRYIRETKNEYTRNDILRQTDCKDCKWWEHCYGGCSGLAIDFDWRNKDRYCELHKALFEKTKNIFDVIGIKLNQEKNNTPCIPANPDNKGQNHSDGIEHIDGTTRHLDG